MTIPRIPDAPTCLHCGAALVDIGPDTLCELDYHDGWCVECGQEQLKLPGKRCGACAGAPEVTD